MSECQYLGGKGIYISLASVTVILALLGSCMEVHDVSGQLLVGTVRAAFRAEPCRQVLIPGMLGPEPPIAL